MLAENIQTWQDNIRAAGWKDGLEEGLLSVVLNMLKKQFSFSQISEVTGYSVAEVERLAPEQQNGKM